MSNTTQSAAANSFSCPSCAKRFAWKPELAGKRVKCKCGGVISVPAAAKPAVPQREAGDEPDLGGLYDLANEAQAAAAAPAAGFRCPSCGNSLPVGAALCVQCGFDMRTGKRITATAEPISQGAAPTLAYKTAEKAGGFNADNLLFEGSKFRSLYLPAALILVGVGVKYWEVSVLGMGAFGAALIFGFFAAAIAVDFVMLFIAMIFSARVFGIAFGAASIAILKLVAISIGPGALGVITQVYVTNAADGFSGMAAGAIVSIALYFLLIKILFQLDMTETFELTTMIYLIRNWIGRLALIGLIAMLSSADDSGASGAAAVAIAQGNSPPPVVKPKTPEELAVDGDRLLLKDLAEHRRLNRYENWRGLIDPYTTADDTAKYVKDLEQQLGVTVNVTHVVEGKHGPTAKTLVFDLPSAESAPNGAEMRKKVFEWADAHHRKLNLARLMRKDVGQSFLFIWLDPSVAKENDMTDYFKDESGAEDEDDDPDEMETPEDAAAQQPQPPGNAPDVFDPFAPQ